MNLTSCPRPSGSRSKKRRWLGLPGHCRDCRVVGVHWAGNHAPEGVQKQGTNKPMGRDRKRCRRIDRQEPGALMVRTKQRVGNAQDHGDQNGSVQYLPRRNNIEIRIGKATELRQIEPTDMCNVPDRPGDQRAQAPIQKPLTQSQRRRGIQRSDETQGDYPGPIVRRRRGQRRHDPVLSVDASCRPRGHAG